MEEFFKQYWKLILFFLFEFGLSLSIILTNFYYSPTHRSISDCLACLFVIIYTAISVPENSNYNSALEISLLIIGFPILLIGCFVYNELIIFHFFGMDYNTSNEVTKRAIEEQQQFESIKAKLIVNEAEKQTIKVDYDNEDPPQDPGQHEEDLSPK